MANKNIEVINAMKAIIADGAIIGPNELGIVEIDGDFPIIPKNVVVAFSTEDECKNHRQCENCHYGGFCNSVEYEYFTFSKVGGRSTMTFVRCRGYQPGSVWTRWQRIQWIVKYDLGMSINCLYSIGDNMAKISKRNMLAHLNELNKKCELTDEQKINSNKKSVRELDKYGVVLL